MIRLLTVLSEFSLFVLYNDKNKSCYFTCVNCFVNRYVENICKCPTEEKFRKIKLSNKVFQVCKKLDSVFLFLAFLLAHFYFVLFQEKVRSVEGSREFLEALGFISVTFPVDGQGELNNKC